MKIVVTTPTGNIGRVLTPRLLDSAAEVVLTVRQPEKVKELVDRGATALQGSLEDADFVREATRGADVLFWLTPPKYDADDFCAYQVELGRIAAAALQANEIPRVVHLSSIGAQHATGVGPVKGLHQNERLLNEVAPNITHLRPGAFMENILASVETIQSAKSIFLPVRGDVPIPWVATRDIGEFAAKRILDETWSGQSEIELLNDELTYDQIASTLSEALGETITHVRVTPEQALEAITALGLSPSTAGELIEIYKGFDARRLVPVHPRTAEHTMKTTFTQFAREVIAPFVKESTPDS